MKAKQIFIYTVILITAFFMVTSEAQTSGPTDRVYYGARLELKHMIYNGAGQDADGFKNYFNLMPADLKPSLYTYYLQLKNPRRGKIT